ncbi:MAG: UDP-N-acetylmuramoyl-L-alanine--D-glutamate ligase [Bacteroidota bacterium]
MKKIAVLGGGESGVGAAILAVKKGYQVFLSDKGKIKPHYAQELNGIQVEWEQEQHSEAKILTSDLVIKSPGIPDEVPIVQQAIKKGLPVVSEIEFAYRYTNANIIGVTGSNGKTTVTNMIFHILNSAGFSVAMAGNIGDSFARKIANQPKENYVLELSSFQLDGIIDFRPHIAIITSITPDHLDRYNNSFEAYVAAKFNITKNQTKDDFLIYNADEEVIANWIQQHSINARLIPMSAKNSSKQNSIYKKNNNIEINIDNKIFTMPISQLSVEGEHNTKNAMASSAVAKLLQIRKNTIRESMETFQGVEHRLEKVLKLNKVSYINDSKATNINATYYALESMKNPTVWIVGGVDKGNNYAELLPLVNEKVKAIICLGIDNEPIKTAFSNVIEEIHETNSMTEAVSLAYKISEQNENVLLSPACASFDLFENYEDRGRKFKEAVRKL